MLTRCRRRLAATPPTGTRRSRPLHLNPDPLNFLHADVVVAPVVKARRFSRSSALAAFPDLVLKRSVVAPSAPVRPRFSLVKTRFRPSANAASSYREYRHGARSCVRHVEMPRSFRNKS